MLHCYVNPGKSSSRRVCAAFAEGCGGLATESQRLLPGEAFFYGVQPATLAVWREVVAQRRGFIFGDNSYFDSGRGRYYRVTRGAMQLSAMAAPDYVRWDALKIKVRPRQAGRGRHVVVVEQSEPFLELVGEGGGWLKRTLAALSAHTDRALRVRPWRRDKGKASSSLQADLVDAWALVTHMSAAANEAILAGVPVFVTGPCAALPLASGPLENIERPLPMDVGRVRAWAAGLAANQWTTEELKSGAAWRALNGER